MPWTTARNRVELGAPVVGGERQRLPASAQGALSAWDIRPGQAFTAVAPNGAWWRMRRLDGADLPELLPIEPITNPEPPIPVVLAAPLADKNRMEWIVEKAVECGATAVIPTITAKSLQSLEEQPQRRDASWRGKALKAAKQCRRGDLPLVGALQRLEEVVASSPERTVWLAAREDRLAYSLRPWDALPTAVGILVGPEGGWSDEDLAWFEARGILPLGLGPRVLRVETACALAVATAARWVESE